MPRGYQSSGIWYIFSKRTKNIDTAIDMYNALITSVIRRSKNDLDNLTKKTAKEKNKLVILLRDIGAVLLNEEIDDQHVRNRIYQEIIPEVEELRKRIYDFVVRIVNLVKELPNNLIGNRIGGQLLDAGTSVGANFEEACAAFSKADFTYNELLVAVNPR